MYRSYKNKDVKAVGILVPFDMIQPPISSPLEVKDPLMPLPYAQFKVSVINLVLNRYKIDRIIDVDS